jgi:uncharacterized protein YndB with AHSA1/START domain
MEEALVFSVEVECSPAVAWADLVDCRAMERWMGEREMALRVQTDWVLGGPISISGYLHGRFENVGTVEVFEPCVRLRYSHLSSISALPDEAASYSHVDWSLEPSKNGTLLRLSVSGFPNEVVRRHLELYWRGTLPMFKAFVEARPK